MTSFAGEPTRRLRVYILLVLAMTRGAERLTSGTNQMALATMLGTKKNRPYGICQDALLWISLVPRVIMLTMRPPSCTFGQYPSTSNSPWVLARDRGERTYNNTGLVSGYNEASGSRRDDFGLVDGNNSKFHANVNVYEVHCNISKVQERDTADTHS